jgi:transcriptional regulator with XRE-family HTH domain
MLADAPTESRVSTGLEVLDDVLGGLYWGDNVVWQLDHAPVEPFYRAIASSSDVFDSRTVVSLGAAVNTYGVPGLAFLDASAGSALAQPADLLRELHRRCRPRGRRLLLLESLETMARTWGVSSAREFFARLCPLLLEVGAIAYWTMGTRETPSSLQDAVMAAAQCVLRVDERSVRVIKADGRADGVAGLVMHWREEAGRAVLAPPDTVGRVAASLRAIRRARALSQHELGDLAGVSASAISQVERAERGLSVATLLRLSAALGVTVDDLLHGEDPGPYRIGRRTDGAERGLDHTITLLGGADVRIDLVHLDPRESGGPAGGDRGTGIVAVAGGLVQVRVGGQTPTVRQGEVLVADRRQIDGWRNAGQGEAVVFWIVLPV